MHYVRNFDNPLGGTEQFVKGLIRHLSAYDVRQSIVTNSTDAEAKESHIDTKITVISLPSRTSGAYQILKGLPSILERNRYDIINIHGYGEFTGDLVCILKKLSRHICATSSYNTWKCRPKAWLSCTKLKFRFNVERKNFKIITLIL